MKAIYIIIFGLLALIGCKKDNAKAEEDPFKITADKWTKVSNEEISGFYDVKIGTNNSIHILSHHYYQLNNQFKTENKYMNYGANDNYLTTNQFIGNELNFFMLENYGNFKKEYIISFFEPYSGNFIIKNTTSPVLFPVLPSGKEIYSFIKSDNTDYLSYCSMSEGISDSIYIFGLKVNQNNIYAEKIHTSKRYYYSDKLVALKGNFICFDKDRNDFITIDKSGISHINQIKYRRIMKLGEKLLIFTNDNKLLSSMDGLTFTTEIENIKYSFDNEIFPSTNNFIMATTGLYEVGIININTKSQKLIDLNGVENLSQYACFPYLDKLVLLTNKGIYVRLVQ